MQAHPLIPFAARLVEEHGIPRILDVDNSIQVHRPTLTGPNSVSSYYIRPPDGMSAEELIGLFEQQPGFDGMRLTLTSILGLDTYHQPLISADDFAKKYFGNNQERIVRVVGKSDQAIAAMGAFIEGVQLPFSAAEFPHHSEFALSGFRDRGPGRSSEAKLLFKPADPYLLMQVEREVKLHFSEFNMNREVQATRHHTRDNAPEIILTSGETPIGRAYLEALANSLPRASEEEVKAATRTAQQSSRHTEEAPKLRAQFSLPQTNVGSLPPAELKRRVVATLADILKQSWLSDGLAVQVTQGGAIVEVNFPRTAASLWLASSFDERKHMKAVERASVALRADPMLRDGWDLHYRFDKKTGNLQLRAADSGAAAPNGSKVVPRTG